MKKTILLFALILFSQSFVWAQQTDNEKCLAQLAELIRNPYLRTRTYKLGQCSTNCTKLLDIAATRGIDLSKTNILIIVKGNKPVSFKTLYAKEHVLYPIRNLQPIVGGWAYHVVIETQGRIIDLDYDSLTQFNAVDQYFPHMFTSFLKRISHQRNDGLANVYVREVPALRYIEAEEHNSLVASLVYKQPLTEFPLVSLEEYLQKKARH